MGRSSLKKSCVPLLSKISENNDLRQAKRWKYIKVTLLSEARMPKVPLILSLSVPLILRLVEGHIVASACVTEGQPL